MAGRLGAPARRLSAPRRCASPILASTGSQIGRADLQAAFAAILFFGAKSVIAATMTVGGLVAFNMFAQRVSGPVIRMAQLWQDFQQVRISVERLGDILNHPVERQGGIAPRHAGDEGRGPLRGACASATRPTRRRGLNDVTFSLPRACRSASSARRVRASRR